MGITSLTLGIVGLLAWLVPFIGFPVTIIGLIMGAISLFMKRENRGKALAGLLLCLVGLILTMGKVLF